MDVWVKVNASTAGKDKLFRLVVVVVVVVVTVGMK